MIKMARVMVSLLESLEGHEIKHFELIRVHKAKGSFSFKTDSPAFDKQLVLRMKNQSVQDSKNLEPLMLKASPDTNYLPRNEVNAFESEVSDDLTNFDTFEDFMVPNGVQMNPQAYANEEMIIEDEKLEEGTMLCQATSLIFTKQVRNHLMSLLWSSKRKKTRSQLMMMQ